MFPEEENDRRSGSGAKTTRFQVVMHFDSDEEEQTENQDDIQQNQYQLLSQDLNGQDDDEEENDEDGENDGRDRTLRVAWTASFDDFQVQNSHADADAIPSNQSIAIDNHQAKCVEPLFEQHSSENGQQDIQREWNQKDELSEGSKMELNQERIESIKECMSNISIHPSAVPGWANVIPEEKLTDFIYSKLKLNANKLKEN